LKAARIKFMLLVVVIFLSACGSGNANSTGAEPFLEGNQDIRTAQDSEYLSSGFSLVKSSQQFTARETYQAGIGDLDGDGDPDVVFANPQRNNSEIWYNDGSGVLTDSGQKLTMYGHGVVIDDFDADGDLDAFIACHQFVTGSKLYLNDGTGRMLDSTQEFGDSSISASDVNLVDLNGDGHSDLHVVYYSISGLPDRIYLNDGNGQFSDRGLALVEDTIAWGDLDGDGDLDYFGKRWGSGYLVQLNQDGGVSPGWQLDDPQSNLGAVALADFDGDGDLDALVVNGHRNTGSGPSYLFWNDGNGRFSDSGQALNQTIGADLSVGDLDSDGDLDVFVANMDLPNEVWLNQGRGNLIDSGLRLGEPQDLSGKPALVDLDADGDLDVLVGSFAGPAELWINSGP
jgi:hypothetical protein